jgi:hypothetical protein
MAFLSKSFISREVIETRELYLQIVSFVILISNLQFETIIGIWILSV